MGQCSSMFIEFSPLLESLQNWLEIVQPTWWILTVFLDVLKTPANKYKNNPSKWPSMMVYPIGQYKNHLKQTQAIDGYGLSMQPRLWKVFKPCNQATQSLPSSLATTCTLRLRLRFPCPQLAEQAWRQENMVQPVRWSKFMACTAAVFDVFPYIVSIFCKTMVNLNSKRLWPGMAWKSVWFTCPTAIRCLPILPLGPCTVHRSWRSLSDQNSWAMGTMEIGQDWYQHVTCTM